MEEVIEDNIREVGDKVQIRSFEWYNLNKDDIGTIRGKMNGDQNSFIKDMYVYCGQIGVIKDFVTIGDKVVGYRVYIDDRSECWTWQNWMFEDEPSAPAIVMEKIIEILSDHQMHEISEKAPDIIIGQMQLKVKGVYLNKNNDIMFIYYGGDYPLHVNDRIATYILYLLLMNHIVKSFNIEQIYDTHRR